NTEHCAPPSVYGEPAARAAVTPCETGVELCEGLEQPVQVALGDAHPGVANGEADVVVTALHLESDLAPVGELHRVPREVDEDLSNLVDVARHPDRFLRSVVAETE